MTYQDPNFERLLKVLFLEGEPDRVPFYELFAERDIIENITGQTLSPSNITERYDLCHHIMERIKKGWIKHDLKIFIKFLFIDGL